MITGLKMLRIQKNLRQADIEKATEIPQPRYSRLERREAKATPEEIESLALFFGLELKDSEQSKK